MNTANVSFAFVFLFFVCVNQRTSTYVMCLLHLSLFFYDVSQVLVMSQSSKRVKDRRMYF